MWAPRASNKFLRLFKPIFFKPFGQGQGWRTFLRARAHIADNFRRNSFECGKPVFISTVFPIILVTSQRSVQVGAPCICSVGPTIRPTQVRRTYFVCRLSYCCLCVTSSNVCLQVGYPNLFVLWAQICLIPVQSALLHSSPKRNRHCYRNSTVTRDCCCILSLHGVPKS